MVMFIVGTLATGCSYFKRDKENFDDETAEQLYENAKASMAKRNWDTAVERLRLLEAKYPYGVYAEQAQIDTIYSYYRSEQSGLAIAAADRFIKLHPTHQSADYAYYLKGLASFNEDDSMMGILTGQNDLSDRDATNIRNAMLAFEDVYNLFPDSQYAGDARKRADKLLAALARNEIVVANFYYSRNAFVAVVNRAKGIIENYASTPSVEQALALMMFGYQNMGINDLAGDARRVLELNFPESEFLNQTMAEVSFTNRYSPKSDKKKDKKGWFSSILDRLKKDEPSS